MATKEKMDITLKKVVCRDCPTFRVSFPNVYHPGKFEGEEESNHSITMLFPKSTNMTALKTAAKNAAKEFFGEDEKKWPKGIRWPFRDGDEKENLDGYKDQIFVRAISKKKPRVVDQRREDIPEDDSDGLYAGCYAKATLIAFGYDNKGNKGVGFSFQLVQKQKDGERFDGSADPENDCDDVSDGDAGSTDGDDGMTDMGIN